MGMELANASSNSLAAIASINPQTAWLYAGGNRISIDNDHRDGFLVKGSDEKLTELRAIVVSAAQLHSHRQPDDKRDAARHADQVEWCESRDGRQTNAQGNRCGDCPAFSDCKWKIELTLLIADREGEYLLTIPTASAMRFKAAVVSLAKQHSRHFSQVVWRMWVTTEKQSSGNVFPVVNFEPLDPDGGQQVSTSAAPAAPAAPAAQPQKKNTLVVERGFDMSAFREQVCEATGKYYRDAKTLEPDPIHINKTILKLGFGKIGKQNADEVIAALQAYAESK